MFPKIFGQREIIFNHKAKTNHFINKMNKLLLLSSFLAIISQTISSQELYVKAASFHNFSTNTQPMPEYFTFQAYLGSMEYDIGLSVNDFSIATGLNLQGSVGYSFNDFLSLELKFSTFSNSKKEFPSFYAENRKTEWDYHNYCLLPTILFGQTFKKSTVSVFVYSGFGIDKLNIIASYNSIYSEYELTSNYNFSWGYGLEYNLSLLKNLSLFANIGINNTNYKPTKAKLISSSYSMEYMETNQKEIEYVDEIINLNSYSDRHSPEIRLREKLGLNSVYSGIGIKYSFFKK